MPYNSRDPGAATPQAAHQYPVTRTLALLVLFAVIALAILRHVYGVIRVEAGAR